MTKSPTAMSATVEQPSFAEPGVPKSPSPNTFPEVHQFDAVSLLLESSELLSKIIAAPPMIGNVELV